MTPYVAPFSVRGTPARLPVLLSVPHAGRAYSPALLAASRLPVSALAILEDPLVDGLTSRAAEAGAAAIVAQVPRAEIDLNRSLGDLDPTMMAPPPRNAAASRRAIAGLGLIPSRLAGHGPIWRRSLPAGEVERRIAMVHGPYHQAIDQELRAIRGKFGAAVLIDCHSMPPRGPGAPGLVLGDCFGASSDEALVGAAEAVCREFGVPTVRNDPYAGGEIVARHGRPREQVHALQIEIDRRLYLAPDLRSAGVGFDRIAALIGAMAESLARAATPLLLAAE